MSLAPTLSVIPDQEPTLDLLERCRFCGCTEERACRIYFAQSGSVIYRLVFDPMESDFDIPCSWLVPGVCNSPVCVEKLLVEARTKFRRFGS